MHPSQEILSAYLDGELTPAEALSVGRHARECVPCGQALRSFGDLDTDLAEPPALACEAARALVSARHDGELDAETARIAEAHLDGCVACQAASEAWVGLDAALAALPLKAPSERVDAALGHLRREPAAGRRPRLALPTVAWPVRALAPLTVALALLLALPQAGPELASPEPLLVASIQQSVFDARTGTLYVLHSQEALVAALDASTLAPRTTIAVGGKPTALALNQATEQILVLDADAKTVTTIDSRSNSVIASTPFEVPGTPTSIQVDGAGKVVVATIISDTSGGAGPAPSAARTTAPQSGAVAVLDPATKQVQTISQVDVAPRQVVIEPSGKRALLVSSQGTTIVDAATYKPLDRAPGGIAAAFSGLGGEFAVLSLRDGTAFVNLSGRRGVALAGSPRAITPLPGGGYAVLTETGGGGRITTLAADGTVGPSVSAPAGRDITFDPLTGNLAVISAAGVANVSLSVALAAQPSTPAATAPPISPASPAIVATTPPAPASLAQSASPSAAPSASAAPSGSPATSSPPAPVAAAPSPDASLIPTNARLLTGNTYLYAPPRAVRATRVAGDGERVWMLGPSNRLSALHTTTGEVFTVASLPVTAKIAAILPSPAYVYLTDPGAGVLYAVSIRTEKVTSAPLPFLPIVTDAVTSPDDRLWMVVEGLGLVSFDPRSQRTDVADVSGQRFSAVGVDAIGRVWLAPRDRPSLDLYDPYQGKLIELVFPHDGAITAITIDRKAAVWVGTDTGQIIAMRAARVETAASVGRPIDRLVVGAGGEMWYVSRSGGEVTFGPADGSAPALHGPQGMSTPAFDRLGRAWAQDPTTGAFFVTLPGEGR